MGIAHRYGVAIKEVVAESDLQVCSGVFHEAMRPLVTQGGWKRVARLFEDFAAGQLLAYAPINEPGEPVWLWPVNEPDSAFVFLFAELALAQMQIAPQEPCWEQLLPTFLKMQLYYLERFGTERPDYLSEYCVPPNVLTPAQRSVLDASFIMPSQPQDVEAMITKHLMNASKQFARKRRR